MTGELFISFPGVSSAEQSRLTNSLRDQIDHLDDVQTSIKREREDTQDPGTILSIVLGAPAVVLAVKELARWAMRNHQPSVVLEIPGKTKVEFKNLKSDDVPKALEALKGLGE